MSEGSEPPDPIVQEYLRIGGGVVCKGLAVFDYDAK